MGVCRIKMIIVSLFVLFISSCGPSAPKYSWRSEPSTSVVRNNVFEASVKLSPCASFGCDCFDLKVENATSLEIQINWNKTYYVKYGHNEGRFLLEGEKYLGRQGWGSPDTVFPGRKLFKLICPSRSVYFSRQEAKWLHKAMDPGQQGVYLTVIAEGKEISESLSMTLIREDMTMK